MRKKVKMNFMYVAASVVILFSLTTILTLQQGRFGKSPKGERLERIKKSPNYNNGSFQNQSYTPVMAEDAKFWSIGKEMMFDRKERVTPLDSIPSQKTDLLHLDKDEDVLVWFGHSSYFIQLDGKKFLVDPVLSGHASPFSFSIKAFKGADVYKAEDIPEIDYLFISHDHWDHLDYETISKLKSRIRKVICGLGTGAHFEKWGFKKEDIIELDWYEQACLDDGFMASSVPARHFSGRTFKRNNTLWTALVLQSPTMKIFLGGDGGYDKHFAEAGKTFGEIDLAIMENGQYNKNWKYIHMLPDEQAQAFRDLNAKRLFTVHNSKFALANHAWDEPLIKAAAMSKEQNIPLLTPMIGEKVFLKDTTQQFTEWWKNVK
jgi:L-ascorbate metabolism protein UlaG (beta-lactamase superfamily)